MSNSGEVLVLRSGKERALQELHETKRDSFSSPKEVSCAHCHLDLSGMPGVVFWVKGPLSGAWGSPLSLAAGL